MEKSNWNNLLQVNKSVDNKNIYKREQYLIGGILTGSKILEEVENGNISITPFDETKINPNSYNLTLNEKLLIYSSKELDFNKENKTDTLIIPEKGLILYPGRLYLGRTNEECYTNKYIPIIDGRSSVGRLGVTIHVTAGYGDIGWRGTWTLEITVQQPIKIYPNIEFCQIRYLTSYGNTDIQYDGRYQNQYDVVASRFNLDKKIYVKGD